MNLIKLIFNTKNQRELKKIESRVIAINNLETKIKKLSNINLRKMILNYKTIISTKINHEESSGKLNKHKINKILDVYLNEVFAIVREVSKRVLNMRHFNVQLIGGIVLNNGCIAEMKTGEGKTLAATLPAVLNSLTGRSVHIVTVNDYLAARDAEWMGRIYKFLGLNVNVLTSNTNDSKKHSIYKSDIIYGQNNEFGFDYLRDNMKFSLDHYMQRDHVFAIIDEVDSILIDEARTPLIISGDAKSNINKYFEINNIIYKLYNNIDFSIDEKSKIIMLTENGINKCENLLNIDNLYDPININLLYHLNQALRAHSLFKRDVDYVIENNKIVIVDEHTGRLMHGRRWSDGLHQAIEAKENLSVQTENQILATITFQNLFRMYTKLSGMTATADTEAEEFSEIYGLNVVVIPTNKPLIRIDYNDVIYKTKMEKFNAILDDILLSYDKKQPVLVGTISVEQSEFISKNLLKLGINHNVLNAKRNKQEAGIIAQAGRLGSVTIATNMAGRGTDIILGGDAEFMSRTKVAILMNKHCSSSFDFSFLTGKPEFIDINSLSYKSKYDKHHFINIDYNYCDSDYVSSGDIFIDQSWFYLKSIDLYNKELKLAIEICNKERINVLKVGGLRVIGTERHESRRIDNQLRGRSGRQGDPGSTSFYLSLQDNLMRIFGSSKIMNIMDKLGIGMGIPIKHVLVSKSIANAQKRVESFYFDSRKQLIDYDDVINQQRIIIYNLRLQVLGKKDIRNLIFDLVEQSIINLVQIVLDNNKHVCDHHLNDLNISVKNLFNIMLNLEGCFVDSDDLMDSIFLKIENYYCIKERNIGLDIMRNFERYVYLNVIDEKWKDHLQIMEHLREGIQFRGYAQKDPKQEYRKEGYRIFMNMIAHIRNDVLAKVFKLEIKDNILLNNNTHVNMYMNKENICNFNKFNMFNDMNKNINDNEVDKSNALNRKERRLFMSRKNKKKRKRHS